MGTIQADKSLNTLTVIIMVLLSTMLPGGAAFDVRSAAHSSAITLFSLASMQFPSRFSTISGTSAVTQPSTNVEECYEWTEWMDDEDGGTLEPSSIGEFELIHNLRGPYGFCDEPTDIECALADDTNTPYNETGQVSLTCNLQQGFMCFHSQQSGDCFNYAIRVLCETPCQAPTTRGKANTRMSSTSMQYSSRLSTYLGTDIVTQPSTTVGKTCTEWTEWMDDENGTTLEPSSIGEFELIHKLRGPYGFCNETMDIECALADDTNTPYNETGQVSLTCNLQQGFLCFHSQQSGDCFNYAIRVLCETPCQAPTTRGKANTRMSSTSMQYSSRLSTYLGTDIVTQPSTTVGKTCTEWTEWMDDENGGTLDPSSIGEFELIHKLRGPYGFCDEPTDIECALADDTNTPYNETGQVSLTCDLQQGFMCFHSQQSGDCFNYAIRVLCPAPCPSLTAPISTIVPGPPLTTPASTPVPGPSLTTPTSTPVPSPSLTTPASTPVPSPSLTTPTSTPVPDPSLTTPTSTPIPSPSLTTPGNTMTTWSSTSVQVLAEQSTNPEVTRVPTTQSSECGEDDDTDCSAKTLTCPREFRLKCNVTISSEMNIGRCLQQNITKTSIEELWTTLNKTIPVCCFSTNFTWIQQSRRRRDTTGSMAILVSDLLVDDSVTVDAQTVLEAFISSINQSSVFKSYGISYEPGTASVIEPGGEIETSKQGKDYVKIVIVVCSTIAGLIVVIAVALCALCTSSKASVGGGEGNGIQ
ncbi:mucin-5AC-like isoform X2 [Ptychodera flava]|uniref:mucin-5AC-like isoform X2 n=1 Tax=Ptychodera flava TaxID=63121 RepID=UPI00396A7F01